MKWGSLSSLMVLLSGLEMMCGKVLSLMAVQAISLLVFKVAHMVLTHDLFH